MSLASLYRSYTQTEKNSGGPRHGQGVCAAQVSYGENAQNCRPASLNSALCKHLKRTIRDQLGSHFVSNMLWLRCSHVLTKTILPKEPLGVSGLSDPSMIESESGGFCCLDLNKSPAPARPHTTSSVHNWTSQAMDEAVFLQPWLYSLYR